MFSLQTKTIKIFINAQENIVNNQENVVTEEPENCIVQNNSPDGIYFLTDKLSFPWTSFI